MERSLDTLLQKSRLTKDSRLLLQCLHLKEMPDLSEFTWVYELNLGNNEISVISKNKFPPRITSLELYQNKLNNIDVDDLPETVTSLNIGLNNITDFDGSKFVNIKKLLINSSSVINFKYPPKIESLDISNNSLHSIDDLPENLTMFDCSNNYLNKLPKLNGKLEKIDMSHNEIGEFPEFPDSTTIIEATTNKISEVKKLPSGIEELNLKDNKLNVLDCVLPPSLTILNLCDNLLTDMPDLPTNIEEVDVSDNRIGELKTIPDSVKILDISNNMLTEIPDELKKRNIKLSYHKNLLGDSDSESDEFDFETFWSSGSKSHESHANQMVLPATPQISTPPTYQPYSGTGYKVGENTHTVTHYYQGRPYQYPSGSYSGNWNSSYIDRVRTEMSSVYANSKARKTNPNYVSIKNKKNIIV